ncbi:phytanoyl-CoA dioxygenase [Spirosoma sp. HMF4905]|uniref:Phytanoyl-CoA dioxygenase n=1 Tax=Spirosoma arboris TaxID=2682092 RepID=A0A7K1SJW1_9BACT|nr:phytanoyl-CoA dioxygenase family protein [Spirosoma arboris]MVM34082.1 phytanoyl-CoA dioxygenase [Spirosoma arboris]
MTSITPTTKVLDNPPFNMPWVESPFFTQELNQSNLDPELKEIALRFAKDGYVIFDPQISGSVLDKAIAGVEPLYKGGARVQDAWETVSATREIATAPRILEVLRILYRREPIPFQTLNFPVGTQQLTHSDAVHFNSIPQKFMCGVWVALEDIHNDNGPLHYYPGSHKLPFYDMIDMGLSGSSAQTVEELYGKEGVYREYEKRLATIIEAQGLKKMIMNMPKGNALIWASNLLHGGEPINDPTSSRHSQVTHYFFEDCVYYTPLRSDTTIDKLFVRKIRNIITGKLVPNKYFGRPVNQDGHAKAASITGIVRSIGRMLPKSLIKKIKR